MGVEKFKVLAGISGTNEKMEYVKREAADEEFIESLRFFCDPKVVTSISSKKLEKKLSIFENKEFESVIEFLEYLKNQSGKDQDLANINAFLFCIDPVKEEILRGIIIKKYPINFGATLFNKVFPDKKIKLTPYMRCDSFDKKKIIEFFKKNRTALSQKKNDGCFVNIYYNGSTTSRSGEEMKFLGNLRSEINLATKNFCPGVMIGEILMTGYERSVANGIINSIISTRNKGDEKSLKKFTKDQGNPPEFFEEKLYIKVWDFIPLEEFEDGAGETPYHVRLSNMREIIKDSKLITETDYVEVRSYAEALKHLKEMLTTGFEGTVLKSLDGVFKDGTPNYQIKMKTEFTVELKIVGFTEGKKGSSREGSLGSVDVISSCGLLTTGVSGFTKDMQKEIWENKETYLNKIIEVKCNGVSNNRDGGTSLLYANFVKVRGDKTEADSLERIKEIEKAALELSVEAKK